MPEQDLKWFEDTDKIRHLRFIDGVCRYVRTADVVGFCHCDVHKGYLNSTLLKKHECIEKNCSFLEKYEGFPFWLQYAAKQREKAERKKAKKSHMKQVDAKQASIDKKMSELYISAQSIADKLGYNILITGVVPRFNTPKNYEYIVNYVSFSLHDDWYRYHDLAIVMAKCYGGKYILRHVRLPNGEYASIRDWKRYSVK
jgi:hypothetical protein